ncbi:hypothetical protein TAMA11512_18310 [Selenomonas sp. TAMA-11512]|uniref:hypothetical protein n=1 Tax=Selenomonas sp. TAMA-11512 TaxID=3095337 RepID=UPI003086C07D|nr:hypothetical protein TAMA11512_18310 [Selenomonas sp. TAMA-11512]
MLLTKKNKKRIAALMLGAFAFAGTPVVTGLSDTAVAEAARGGARMSAPRMTPKPAPSAPKSNAAPSQQKTGPNQEGYKPSQKADQIKKDAPASNTAAPASASAAAPKASASPWGGMMRSIGLLAGGMMLGGLLTSLLGGSEFMADVLGLLANVAIFALAFMAIRFVWSKLRGRKEENVYASSASRSNEMNITPSAASGREAEERLVIPNIGGTAGSDYDAKSMADRYRNR